jgi:predicted aldo/keto reductase-like oxidoreductase
MRLPVLPGRPDTDIDIERVKAMVDLYMERGFSYFDTAHVYHGGRSEIAFCEAISSRYPRDSYQVTTKLPIWGGIDRDGLKAKTQESLERTGLDYFDLYFLHGIGPGSLDKLDEIGAWDYLRDVKRSGKARNVGFSYHGDAKTLGRILDTHGPDEVDIVQLQINYLDWESPDVQSRLCYEEVARRDIGVIVMEPLRGGSLVTLAPEVSRIFTDYAPETSLANWALRFPMSLPGVITSLSGMSTIEQVDENTQAVAAFSPLDESEREVIGRAVAVINEIPLIPCTSCRYCVDDCPEHINTPRIIELLNDFKRYNDFATLRRQYTATVKGVPAFNTPGSGSPSACIRCGSCEEHCPQHIPIMDTHEQVVALLRETPIYSSFVVARSEAMKQSSL